MNLWVSVYLPWVCQYKLASFFSWVINVVGLPSSSPVDVLVLGINCNTTKVNIFNQLLQGRAKGALNSKKFKYIIKSRRAWVVYCTILWVVPFLLNLYKLNQPFLCASSACLTPSYYDRSHLPKAPHNSSKLWPVRSARMRRSDLSSETPKYLQVARGENPGPPKTGPKLMVMLPCSFFFGTLTLKHMMLTKMWRLIWSKNEWPTIWQKIWRNSSEEEIVQGTGIAAQWDSLYKGH